MRDRLPVRLLGLSLAAVFVVSLVASMRHGHRGSLPSIALKWPFLLDVERAGAVTLIALVLAVVIGQLLRGELPSKLSNTGIEWPTAAAAATSVQSAADRAVNRPILDALDALAGDVTRLGVAKTPDVTDGAAHEPGAGPEASREPAVAAATADESRAPLAQSAVALALLQARQNEAFADAVAALSDRQKLVYALSAYEQMSNREIAKVLGASESDVAELARQAHDQLTEAVARSWLQRVVDLYAGLDAGPQDPIHAVREDARRLIAGKPTREDPFQIADRISAALPGDRRASSLRQSWISELNGIATSYRSPQ
jgi:RNA polymerase sigma factor (sigma-70 family)